MYFLSLFILIMIGDNILFKFNKFFIFISISNHPIKITIMKIYYTIRSNSQILFSSDQTINTLLKKPI